MDEGVAGLRAALDIDSFLKKPWGRFVICRTFAFWQLDPGMSGVIVWGAPTVDDVDNMIRVFDIAHVNAGVGRHVSLADTRDISEIDAAAFEKILSYLESRRELHERLVIRQALVVQRGVSGAALSGLHQLIGTTYPTMTFTDPREAIDWLSPPDRDLAWTVFCTLRERVRGAPEVVARLRAMLEAEPRRLSLADAARRLGISSRTLQRRLTEAETSLRKELVVALRGVGRA